MRNLLMIIGAATLLFGSTAVHAQRRVTGSNNYQIEKRKVDSFDNLDVSGSFQVTYKQSKGKPTVEIYAADNILPLIETQVKGNTLALKFKSNTSIQNSGKIQIQVSGPELQAIKLSGSGKVTLAEGMKSSKNIKVDISGSGRIISEELKCNVLYGVVSGSGKVEIDKIKANHVEGTVSGSGKMSLSGNSKSALFKVSGSGSIHAAELKTADVTTNVSGSGSIKVYATDTLNGNVSGSGSVAYKGNPEVTFSKKGLRRL